MIYPQSWRRAVLNKRCTVIFIVFLVIASLLVYSLAGLQIIDHDKYKNLVVNQLSRTIAIEAKRGTIYDRNMNALAVSATTERVFISPRDIPQMTVREFINAKLEKITNEEKRNSEQARYDAIFENKDITVTLDLARLLSSVLGVSEDSVLEKAAKTMRADETIMNKVELELTGKLREAVRERGYTSFVYFAEQSKRYYPYGTLAAHVIGFTGTEGNGLAGVEAYYNSYLSGVNGKVVIAKDGSSKLLDVNYEEYISATDGMDLMLTIDWTVQSILEKYLEIALDENLAHNRVAGIIIDVTNGEILAQATKSDFDLNAPFELDAKSLELLDAFEGTEEKKKAYRSELLYALWKDKITTEIYEPGSTFKIVTSSIALEEKLVNDKDRFYCPGYIKIPGYSSPIRCARTYGHGLLTFAQALQQSCNPAFVTISQRIGTDLFYKYYNAFGYTKKTGIDLPGEASNLFFNLSTFGSVDLAAASFGQNFKVTPISHICAISAIANGGHTITPHILKATLDKDGNVVDTFEPEKNRQIISEETAKELRDILEEGVHVGGSKNAAVVGYSVAAKTGTSVKTELKTDEKTQYTASCVAFAPADDPKIAILIMIDEPNGKSFYGGTIAAPVVSKVLSEVLPYLGIEPKYTDTELAYIKNTLLDYRGLTTERAVEDLKSKKLNYKIIGDGDTVTNQIPAHGQSLMANGVVVLYTNNIIPENTVRVPNLYNMTVTAVNNALTNAGLNLALVDQTIDSLGDATAEKQSIPANTMVAPGTVITVEFRHYQGIE